ncbi:MAG TPA: twin-arginine translocase subunit TatC, partial [Chloroflexota bacterium]|nr:twin-arginine translocase subunit TatC [Chloroflexota bacterium]
MAKVLRPIGHEDRLSMIEHLDELRTRLIVCLAVLIVAFFACFVFNHQLINVLNRALPNEQVSGTQGLASVPDQDAQLRQAFQGIATASRQLAASSSLTAQDRAYEGQIASSAQKAESALPKHVTTKKKPITIGV